MGLKARYREVSGGCKEKNKKFFIMAQAFKYINILPSNQKSAFTLAEVLITLGIIGVVAAMTIPTLISNTNGAKFRSQFKKTISTLNQAGRMAQAQYDFDYAGTTSKCSSNTATAAAEHPDSTLSFCAIFNGTLTGATYYGAHTNIPMNNNAHDTYKIDGPVTDWLFNTGASAFVAYQLSDGSIVAFSAVAMGCELPVGTELTNEYIRKNLTQCIGWIDVNGTTLPNREVTCSSGTNTVDSKDCVVKNDAKHMTDVFPIVFHDGTVEPASGAARYVLSTSK